MRRRAPIWPDWVVAVEREIWLVRDRRGDRLVRVEPQMRADAHPAFRVGAAVVEADRGLRLAPHQGASWSRTPVRRSASSRAARRRPTRFPPTSRRCCATGPCWSPCATRSTSGSATSSITRARASRPSPMASAFCRCKSWRWAIISTICRCWSGNTRITWPARATRWTK